MPDPSPKKAAHNHSFAVPRAAINALIDAQADAVTIGAYLTLAAHTDKTGQYSKASVSAMLRNLSRNKPKLRQVVATLCGIKAKARVAELTDQEITPASKSRGKSKLKRVQSEAPDFPLIYTREAWPKEQLRELDGPTEKSRVRHILSTFNEPLKDRVWFGKGLVMGDTDIEAPLLELKRCGDVAARLLLALYAGQDSECWFGAPPACFPWSCYQMKGETNGSLGILYATPKSRNGLSWSLINRINPQAKLYGIQQEPDEARKVRARACWDALAALESSGFLYEAVVLLDHNPLPSGDSYDVHDDADIVCDLGSPSPYGPLSSAEQGLGPVYEQTATELNLHNLHSYKYLAVVPNGQQGMIMGVYRLRFRVTDPKNPFVEEWQRRQLDTNKAAFRKLNYIRKRRKLDSLKDDGSTHQSYLQSSSIPAQ